MNVFELKAVMAKLPGTARIILEHGHQQYEPEDALAIGTKTDDPGLVIKLRRTR
jgi:hypothetical protein